MACPLSSPMRRHYPTTRALWRVTSQRDTKGTRCDLQIELIRVDTCLIMGLQIETGDSSLRPRYQIFPEHLNQMWSTKMHNLDLQESTTLFYNPVLKPSYMYRVRDRVTSFMHPHPPPMPNWLDKFQPEASWSSVQWC